MPLPSPEQVADSLRRTRLCRDEVVSPCRESYGAILQSVSPKAPTTPNSGPLKTEVPFKPVLETKSVAVQADIVARDEKKYVSPAQLKQMEVRTWKRRLNSVFLKLRGMQIKQSTDDEKVTEEDKPKLSRVKATGWYGLEDSQSEW